jgi:hypothetical protein
MATLTELRERSDGIFTELLEAQAATPERQPRPVGRSAGFSWFDPDDAVEAAALAFRLSALAASRARVSLALTKVLDHVEAEASNRHPELVRQGFALFVTHNRDGRRLAKPRSVVAAPRLFSPPPARRTATLAVSLGGLSPDLDYWREDVLLNEHHQHWHEVYPYAGIPPRDFLDWVATTPRATLVAIVEALVPGQGAALVTRLTPAKLAEALSQVSGSRLRSLAPTHYRAMFRANDRQGELFFFMHQQMLARYDAELVSHGLDRVRPFSPTQWSRAIPEGYDPEGFNIGRAQFTRREENQTLDAGDVSVLRTLHATVIDAIRDDEPQLVTADGGRVPIDPDNLGQAVEASAWQLSGLDPNRYPGLHNFGHGFIAALSPGGDNGVMNSTATAIRDQVFWRWHKAIDELSAEWQATRAAHDFSDAPDVLIRDGLGATPTAWASPDIILCWTSDLPDGDLAAVADDQFGGDRWDDDFRARPAGLSGGQVATIDELTTTMATTAFGGRQIRYLTHEPFTLFVRIENRLDRPQPVTLRLFLAPSDMATDRRAWIELDKALVTVPAGAKLVVVRSDADLSVVKRKVDLSPSRVLAGGTDPDDDGYCDCGWPYTLLLPRGTAAGMPFRLLAIATDAAVDQVPAAGECGSMSYCGAVDRYPDTREMGYPFNRPFDGPTAGAIRDAILANASAAARTVRIRHTS